MNLVHCLHVALIIGKYTGAFLGDFSGGEGEGGVRGSIFPWRYFSQEKGNFPRRESRIS